MKPDLLTEAVSVLGLEVRHMDLKEVRRQRFG